jgi:tetratricopeptide (TPR) repeat protein
MSKISKSTVKTIPLYTAILLAGLAFMAGFISASVLPEKMRNWAFYRSSEASPNTINLNERLQVLEAETEKNPLDEKLWFELGELYSDSNLPDKAISAYQKVLAINPSNADVWTEIGILQHKSGKPDNSIEALDKAIAIDPKHENSRFIKGFVLMHGLKNRDGAIHAWEELLEINPLAMAPNGQSVDQLIQHYRKHVKTNS